MKRIPDLLKSILLKIESMASDEGIYEIDKDSVGATDYEELWLHVNLLVDEGLLRPLGKNPTFNEVILVRGITAKGYDFLESVRDPRIWAFVKNGATKVGSWSLKIAIEMAKKAAEKKAGELLGLKEFL